MRNMQFNWFFAAHNYKHTHTYIYRLLYRYVERDREIGIYKYILDITEINILLHSSTRKNNNNACFLD